MKESDFYTPAGEERSVRAKRVLRFIKDDGNKKIELRWIPEKRDHLDNLISEGHAVIVEKSKPFYNLPNQQYGQ